MTVYISNRQMRHAKKMHITYDLNTLGPRQRIALLRFARTGLFKGCSVARDIALGLRNQHNLGHVNFSSWGIGWSDLLPDEFEPIEMAITTHKITGGVALSKYTKDQLEDIKARKPEGWLQIQRAKVPNMSLKSRSSKLDALLADIESGKVTELTFPIGHNE